MRLKTRALRMLAATPALLSSLALFGVTSTGPTAASAVSSTAPGKLTGPAVTAAPTGPTTVRDQTCPYPYVCFYNSSGTITGKFRDVTSGWQWLTSSRGADHARNTRYDDTVYYHFTDGRHYCAAPRETTYFYAVVDALRIDWSPRCP